MTWTTKALAGFLGALCISLIKLGRAGFYMGTGNTAAIGTYLTYLAYLVVGAAVAVYFAENFEDPHKTRKSAFLFGILAPSVLLTIISTPQLAKEAPGIDIPTLPSLSLSVPFISEALAETAVAASGTAGKTKAGQPAADSAKPAVSMTYDVKTVVLSKKDASPSFSDGVKAALGITPSPPDWMYVVGKTENKDAAAKSADLINSWLQKKNDGGLVSEARIVEPAGGRIYYVALGGGLSPMKAEQFEQIVKASATSTLVGDHYEATDKAAAAMALKGQSIPTSSLFVK